MSNVPYPSEYRLVPRRQRRPSFWLLLLAVAVALGLALAWPHPAAHQEAPARPAAVVHHAPAPNAPAVTVRAGSTVYACSVLPKAKPARAKH
jgi:hypothetical protein